MDDKEDANRVGEIEESDPKSDGSSRNPNPNPKAARTKVPEVEVYLYRRGKGPIDTFRTSLGGWDQNQLEVRDILDKYGFKSLYAFNTGSGRGVPIRFNPRNGRSMLACKDGSMVHINGEAKDSLIRPVTKMLLGVAVITVLITLVFRDPPVGPKIEHFWLEFSSSDHCSSSNSFYSDEEENQRFAEKVRMVGERRHGCFPL